jgi:hypothetical protein
VKAVTNLRVPQNAGNFLTSWETVSFSRRPLLHGVSLSLLSKNININTHRVIFCLLFCMGTKFRLLHWGKSIG